MFAWMGILKGGATGTHNLVVSSTGSCGFAALRIGDIITYDTLGAVVSDVGSSGAGLIDLAVTPQAPGASDLSQQAGWLDERAFPITQYYDATTQWQTRQYTLGAPVYSSDFSSATGWNLGAGWNISAGKANHTTQLLSQMTKTGTTLPSNRYVQTFTLNQQGGVFTPRYFFAEGYTTGHPIAGAVSDTFSEYMNYGVPLTSFGYTANGLATLDDLAIQPVASGMAAWFGRQPTLGANMSLTYEANTSTVGMQGVALAVEIKGLVQP
jgi:hypothetical protein